MGDWPVAGLRRLDLQGSRYLRAAILPWMRSSSAPAEKDVPYQAAEKPSLRAYRSSLLGQGESGHCATSLIACIDDPHAIQNQFADAIAVINET